MPNLLQSQLSFFGAIDTAVLHARRGEGPDPDGVLRMVDSFLPGTTGFGQAGWYRELQEFANRPEVRADDREQQLSFPTVAEAVSDLQAARRAPAVAIAARGVTTTGFQEPPYNPYHDPALARSAYAAMILAKLQRMHGLPPESGVTRNVPAQIMALAINRWQGSATRVAVRQATSQPRVRRLLDQVDEIDSPDDWKRRARSVSPLFAEQSLPCRATLDMVDGQYVSTLYTDARADGLSVADVKKILDPRNWSLHCKFFCAVDAQDPLYTKEGWSRILETISPQPEKWSLRTALKFYYGEDESRGVFLNYDLDPHRQNDSGLVEVDVGYIWLTRAGNGVRIRTSKQERVQGLSPTATAALGGLLGWGDAAYQLLAGTAEWVRQYKGKASRPKLFPFRLTPPADYKSHIDPGPQNAPPAAKPAKLPPIFDTAIGTARDLTDDLIDRTRDVAADVVNRWLDGMTQDDVETISDEVGKNVTEFAVKVYAAAEASVKPQDASS